METAVRKEVLMVKNVKLLGFEVDDAGAAAHGPARSGPELHANAFDRPNEKLLLRVLHFLLVTLSPDAAQVRGLGICAVVGAVLMTLAILTLVQY